MKYRALALATTGLALAIVALFALLPPSARSATLVPLSIAASAGAFAASLTTALRIGWRDRLGLAWLTFGVCHLLLLATTVLVGDSTRTAVVVLSPGIEWTRNALTLGANVFSVVAFVVFARVWTGTGLVPEWRWLATLLSIALTLVVAGQTAWHDLLAVHGMRLAAVGDLVSDVGDIVCFVIIGPVAATAIALRGGALAWPWFLLTLSCVAWLLYDVGGYFGRYEQVVEMSGIVIADLFALAAAVAQGMVTRQARSEGGGA